MNFRECRMVSLNALMNISCAGKLTMEDTFLMLGGIQNSVYYFHMRGLDMIGTGGTAEINCPGIFDELDIRYDTISVAQFEQETKGGRQAGAGYLYVIPVLAEMLNKDAGELKKIGTFGQSFFVVRSVERDKVALYYPDRDTWIDMKLLRKAEQDKDWVVEADFGIYRIARTELENNGCIQKKAEKTKEQFVTEILKHFNQSSLMRGEEGTIRIDGPEAYTRVIEHFENMKRYLISRKDKKGYTAFCNYIYLQLLQFRKFLLSGTDAYYRGEFNVILHKLYGKENKFIDILNGWDELEQAWRNFGRLLSRICTYEYSRAYPEECIDRIVSFWKQISITEPEMIKNTLRTIQIQETA